MTATHQSLNAMIEAEATEALRRCCASPAWVGQMLARRPFDSDAAVVRAAGEIWWSLDRSEWLAAFAAHPKIGDIGSLRAKFASTAAWAASEQAGTAAASDETLRELAIHNQQYENRFGYIFIVCATGKSAQEMLALLKDRLSNNSDSELRTAAAEQLKITLLRLERRSK
jgi:2-oxo-4-hydroxy-4-carboxy-5-ureidoimidazoline decarboxylase